MKLLEIKYVKVYNIHFYAFHFKLFYYFCPLKCQKRRLSDHIIIDLNFLRIGISEGSMDKYLSI